MKRFLKELKLHHVKAIEDAMNDKKGGKPKNHDNIQHTLPLLISIDLDKNTPALNLIKMSFYVGSETTPDILFFYVAYAEIHSSQLHHKFVISEHYNSFIISNFATMVSFSSFYVTSKSQFI